MLKSSVKQTPVGKMFEQVMHEVDLAKKALSVGDKTAAVIHLDYTEVVVRDCVAENPEVLNFYNTALEAECKARAVSLYRVLKKMLTTAEEVETVGTVTDAQYAEALALIKAIEGR